MYKGNAGDFIQTKLYAIYCLRHEIIEEFIAHIFNNLIPKEFNLNSPRMKFGEQSTSADINSKRVEHLQELIFLLNTGWVKITLKLLCSLYRLVCYCLRVSPGAIHTLLLRSLYS